MANAGTMGDTGFRHDVQGLGEGLGAIKSDVATLARGVADTARSGASEIRQGAGHAVEVAKEKFADAKDMARDTYEGARDSATDAAESLKSVIARNPIASIGIAAGAGLLIGLIVMRPRS